MRLATRNENPGESTVTTTEGLLLSIAAAVARRRRIKRGKWGRISAIPMSERSRIGNRLLRPWAAIDAPPMPSKRTRSPVALRSAVISFAARLSPEASPATINTNGVGGSDRVKVLFGKRAAREANIAGGRFRGEAWLREPARGDAFRGDGDGRRRRVPGAAPGHDRVANRHRRLAISKPASRLS